MRLRSQFIKTQISRHLESSLILILNAVDQLVEGMKALAHSVTLVTAEVRTLQKVNEALSKRQRAKKTCVRLGGSLTIEDAHDLLAQQEVQEQVKHEMLEK